MRRLRIRRYSLGRLLVASLTGGLLLAGPRPAAAQEVEAGQRALAAQQYERALEIWRQGLDRARGEGNDTLHATYLFNLGLAWQQWGEEALREGDEAHGRTRLDAAERHYIALLEINPTSGGAYNNLARLYEQTSRSERATEAYRRAIALNDARQPLFLLNYADFLRRQGRAGEAVRLYRQVLEAQPHNARVHEGLVEAYLAADPTDRSGVIAYVWDLVNSGREIRALETALDVLVTAEWAGDEPRIKQQKVDLLTCVAVSLSKGRYAPDPFLESDSARALRTLSAQDPHVGAGARELLLLHQPEAVENAAAFQWWAAQGNPREDPPPGRVWPRDAFRMLIRARGAWHRQQQQDALAEAYYFLSVRLPAEDTDPEALLELAEMYFVDGAPERVDRLMDQYAASLFAGKAEAYRQAQWKKAYDYHRTLGVMYAFIGRWGDAVNPTSAIFQLEQARLDAQRYNEQLQGDEPAQRIHVEPQMIDFLARGYEQIEDSRSAIRVRLDAAEEYERQGDRESSEYVLKPLEPRRLPADLRERYDQIYPDRELERVPDRSFERRLDQQPEEP